MIIKFLGAMSHLEEKTIEVSSFKGLLAGIAYLYGEEVITSLYQNRYGYILYDVTNPEVAVPLSPDFLDLELDQFSHIFIVPEVEGDTGIEAAIAAAASAASASASSAAAAVATAFSTAFANFSFAGFAIMFAISTSVSLIISALTPSPTFDKNPQEAQRKQSSLWNGPVTTFEQGGPVPIIVGRPYCSGTVIASSITTEQV